MPYGSNSDLISNCVVMWTVHPRSRWISRGAKIPKYSHFFTVWTCNQDPCRSFRIGLAMDLAGLSARWPENSCFRRTGPGKRRTYRQ